MKYYELFRKKPVMAMLHLKSGNGMDMLTRAKKEIEIFYGNGVDAVLVENYFGSTQDCETALDYLKKTYPEKIYGINVLGNYGKAFTLASEYDAKFIQIDSVCGHLEEKEDALYGESLRKCRAVSDAIVLGGVRFKYQPVRSGRTLQEDLKIGTTRCDAIVVTGVGTGQRTPKEKIGEFREIIGNFPLITGAGVTLDNVEESFSDTDGLIIGSWLKDEHNAYGEVCEKYVKSFMEKIFSLRGN